MPRGLPLQILLLMTCLTRQTAYESLRPHVAKWPGVATNFTLEASGLRGIN
jgi:hypothetical protein